MRRAAVLAAALVALLALPSATGLHARPTVGHRIQGRGTPCSVFTDSNACQASGCSFCQAASDRNAAPVCVTGAGSTYLPPGGPGRRRSEGCCCCLPTVAACSQRPPLLLALLLARALHMRHQPRRRQGSSGAQAAAPAAAAVAAQRPLRGQGPGGLRRAGRVHLVQVGGRAVVLLHAGTGAGGCSSGAAPPRVLRRRLLCRRLLRLLPHAACCKLCVGACRPSSCRRQSLRATRRHRRASFLPSTVPRHVRAAGARRGSGRRSAQRTDGGMRCCWQQQRRRGQPTHAALHARSARAQNAAVARCIDDVVMQVSASFW